MLDCAVLPICVLFCRTILEVARLSNPTSAAPQVDSALARARAVADRCGLAGLVLTTPGSVAWATGGINAAIDRSASVDVVWLAVGTDRAVVVTTDVEAPRLAAENDLAELGLDLVAVPWWDPQAFVTAAAAAVGAATNDLGSDGHPGFGQDVSHALTASRLSLDDGEHDRIRALGRDAAVAVQGALRSWTPGEPDREVAARIAAAVERVGALAPVLLVGGDDRLRRFRHPVAVGRPLHEVVMAVLVASRAGQHVALTRYASAREPARELAEGLAAVRRIHRRILAACQPGATTGEVVTELSAAYADEGQTGAWRQHYQGGPIGYAQREFEIAPGQTDSPWWSTPLPSGCALAWNPSLPGGAKDEDTYLVHEGAPEAITVTADWPTADDSLPARPAVLVVGN